MATKFVSERNIKFLLYEVFDVESLTQYEYYSQHNRKMFDMVLKAALKLGKDLLFPIFEEMDRKPPELSVLGRGSRLRPNLGAAQEPNRHEGQGPTRAHAVSHRSLRSSPRARTAPTNSSSGTQSSPGKTPRRSMAPTPSMYATAAAA